MSMAVAILVLALARTADGYATDGLRLMARPDSAFVAADTALRSVSAGATDAESALDALRAMEGEALGARAGVRDRVRRVVRARGLAARERGGEEGGWGRERGGV